MGPEAAWVGHRVNAVVSLYDITSEGKRELRGLDVRWMRDQPGFFGSFGYTSWTGVGEARPKGVMHELSHAYWGLFQVTGFPELGWAPAKGKEISPALERYHQDVLKFMVQPPDHHEFLRSRLRTLPELSSSNLEPLLHAMEADAIYTTAGDLDLIPPLLRKYWDRFLRPGPFNTWEEALSWYQALPTAERKLADGYMGFEHFDLREYDSLKASKPTHLQADIGEVLHREEVQRLTDFVQLFDLLFGTPEHKEDFKFWRRYLRDKVELHRKHPELVSSLDLPRAEQIAPALEFLKDLEGKGAEEKADPVITEFGSQPFLVHFLPALENRTLLKLFSSDTELPEGATLKGTAAFVESLESFTPVIKRILEAGRQDVSQGVDELRSYLKGVDFDEKEELELFFEILEGSDSATTKAIVAALDDSILRRLLSAVPPKLRGLLTPVRFLEFLEITIDSPPKRLTLGLGEMITHPSGNFRIDEPFLGEMYRVIAARGRIAPLETIVVIAASPFPLERFIARHPAAAVDLLATDLDITSKMVKDSDPVILAPGRLVYRLIYADPAFAARLVERLDELGETALVVESLAHFAYDADRLQAVPALPISLERDARFLKTLFQDQGAEWLEGRLKEASNLYSQRVEAREAPDDFLRAYERTLRAAASRLEDREIARTLDEIIGRVFR